MEVLNRTIQNPGDTMSTSFRCRHQDGSWRILESIVQPMMDDSGVVSLIINSRDVTERTQAEEALRKSESRNRALLNAIPDSMFRIDKTGTFLDFKASKEVDLLASPDEFLEKRLDEVLPTELAQQTLHYIECALQTGESQMFEYHLSMSDKRRDYEARIVISGEDEVLAIVRDITERKQAEEALKTFAAKLERSNRELQDFAYVASHDLQEPLRKIQAFGDRLKTKYTEALGDQGRDYLERMQNAAARMQSLINDLLAFSRITTKAQPFVSVDLSQLTQEVLSDLEVRIEQVSGHVEVGDLPTIEADPLQMRQLMQNLISNALKFHKAGEPPVVHVHAQHLQEGTPSANGEAICQMIVADNGIGFNEKYLDRIFGIFQRLHSRETYEGTGVGLAICKKIVERHGGHITAKSAPGQGATFIINLPIKQPQGTGV